MACHSAAFLDSIAVEPIFDVEETNKELYDYVPELSEVRVSLHDNTLNSLLTPMLYPRWWGGGGEGGGADFIQVRLLGLVGQ